MSEAFQAFDALTNTRSTGLASLSAGNLYRQQPMVNMDFQRLLGGQPMGVAPRPVSSVTRQQEFLPPVMLQQKAGQDDSDEVPATGLWQAQAKKWPKFSGDVFNAYRR